MKAWEDWTKSELLQLPFRKWDKNSRYDSVLLVNTRKMHDSGYNNFVIVGVKDDEPVECVGYMDDFRCLGSECSEFAIDCSMNGIFRIHSQFGVNVHHRLSTTFFSFERSEK